MGRDAAGADRRCAVPHPRRPEARTILGWSLGGANAPNLGWQYPEVFAKVGEFSPSLWLSPKPDGIAGIQASRFAQQMIAAGAYHPGSRFFFAVGDAEETDDRDGDGVIDVLGDTRDLIDGWRVPGEAEPRAEGLHQLGHSVNLDHAAKGTRADASLFLLAGGKHELASWAKMLPVFLRWAYAVHAPPLSATGTTESWQRMPSRHVDVHDVGVWLPPSYSRDPQRRYPVLYMHGGQNLFDPAMGYTGIDGDIDGAMTRLIDAGNVREAIVVGVWNTPLRFAEYMPKAPMRTDSVGSGVEGAPTFRVDEIRSDAYLHFSDRRAQALHRRAVPRAARSRRHLRDGFEHGRADFAVCRRAIPGGARRRRRGVHALAGL